MNVNLDRLDYLTLATCTLLALGIWKYQRKSAKLPPGPPANLLGNVHHIPRTEPWVAFKGFAEQYGEHTICKRNVHFALLNCFVCRVFDLSLDGLS